MPHARPVNLPASVTKAQFDAFVDGYIETLLYSTNDESDDSGGDPLSNHHDSTSLAPEALLSVETTCARFIEHALRLLNEAVERPGYDWSSAGADLWYTSAGHGVGFWDRDVLDDGGLGNALTQRCQHKEMYVEVGDDGKVHHHGTTYDYRSEAQRIEDEARILRETLAQDQAQPTTLSRARL